MGIGKAIEVLIEIYTKAKDNPQINDAVAYSLYTAWRVAETDKKKGE